MKTAKVNVRFQDKKDKRFGCIYWDGSFFVEWEYGYLKRISHYFASNETTLAYFDGKHRFIRNGKEVFTSVV